MSFCLDTNICIYALKGLYPKIQKELQKHAPSDIKIPALVKGELFLGAKKRQSSKVDQILRQFLIPYEILPFDERASEIYSEIRFELEKKGKPIGPNDLIIAATAIAHHSSLVTRNTKEFSRIRGLRVVDWT